MALLDQFVLALDLAAGNHGILTRPQLRAAGVSSTSIVRLRENRRALMPLGSGMYVVPVLQDLRFGGEQAALQQVDPERPVHAIASDPLGESSGVLSHHSAAKLHGVPDLPEEAHVTVPRRRRLAELTTHTSHLTPEDVTLVEGLPVTTIERTTYDLGRWPMDGEHRSRWVEHVLDEGLLTVDAARELLGPTAEETLMYLAEAA